MDLSIKNIDAYTPDYRPGRDPVNDKTRRKKQKSDQKKRSSDSDEADPAQEDARGNDYLGTQVDLEA